MYLRMCVGVCVCVCVCVSVCVCMCIICPFLEIIYLYESYILSREIFKIFQVGKVITPSCIYLCNHV